MDFRTLLELSGYDPRSVIVLRHRPFEPELNRVLPWLAAERHDLFNAYQQTQGAKLEKSMLGASHVASFIGHAPGKALFAGLYGIGETTPLSFEEYWKVPAYQKLKAFGFAGYSAEEAERRSSILWFDLQPTNFYAHWKGKLIIAFPPPERAWWRRSHKNDLRVEAILEDSALEATMPPWEQIDLSWADLSVLPVRWRAALAQWRGIYLIFDTSDGKSYVGSAYGSENVLGRWLSYAASGHGGNRLLRGRNPENFRFTILQRVSPDMSPEDISELEASWKKRLHTRQPFGLNDN